MSSWSRSYAIAVKSAEPKDMALAILNHPASELLALKTRERIGAIALGSSATLIERKAMELIGWIIHDAEEAQ